MAVSTSAPPDRLYGSLASSMPIAQVSVSAATVRPAPTRPATIAAGGTHRLATTELRTRLPATSRTCRSSGQRTRPRSQWPPEAIQAFMPPSSTATSSSPASLSARRARSARWPDWQMSSMRPPASVTMRRRWASSWSRGRLMAPLMWADSNSAGVRTSTTRTPGLALISSRAVAASIRDTYLISWSCSVGRKGSGGGVPLDGGGHLGHARAGQHERPVALPGEEAGGDGRAAAGGAGDEPGPLGVELAGDAPGEQVGQEALHRARQPDPLPLARHPDVQQLRARLGEPLDEAVEIGQLVGL